METKFIPLVMLLGCAALASAKTEKKPNVIFILVDDVGYGDLSCYGATKINTPNLDKLASQGIRFTNAYAPASTSSPSRYAFLTGEYAYKKGVSIMPGDAPLSIPDSVYTLPKMFKDAGYHTGIVGKWHLGLGKIGEKVNFNKSIKVGPLSVGFDYAYYFPATNDRVPNVFIENENVVGLDKNDPITVSYTEKVGNEPTGADHPEMLKMLPHVGHHDGTIVNGVSRIGWMSGGKNALWKDEEMASTFYKKAVDFIDNQKGEPFFLYYATHNAHEPRIPSKQFRGHSHAGIYGDVIEEMDYYVGKLIEELKKRNLFDNTIIVVTSDNGPMIKEGYKDGAWENMNGHDPYSGLHGEKYSLFEGGVKVPFIVSWPEKIKTPFIQQQPFCFIDMLSTYSSLLNIPLKKKNDSMDGSQLFLEANAPLYRHSVIVQNNDGNIAYRFGQWKFIPQQTGQISALYDLYADPQELHDVQFVYPERIEEIK